MWFSRLRVKPIPDFRSLGINSLDVSSFYLNYGLPPGTKRKCFETKVSNLKRNLSLLENSLALKDREFDSTTSTLHDKNLAYDCLDHEFTDMIIVMTS